MFFFHVTYEQLARQRQFSFIFRRKKTNPERKYSKITRMPLNSFGEDSENKWPRLSIFCITYLENIVVSKNVVQSKIQVI